MPSRSLLLTPLVAALLSPLAASATMQTDLTSRGPFADPPRKQDTPLMCGNEPMPKPNEGHLVFCALDRGVARDTGQDQGPAIRAALAGLSGERAGLFFPMGSYLIEGDLPLSSGHLIMGSSQARTHFINPGHKTSQIVSALRATGNEHIVVERLVLDNIVVYLEDTSKAVVRFNGFRQTTSTDAQIRLRKAGGVVAHNLLWREAENPGSGIALEQSHGVRIDGNGIGVTDPEPAGNEDPHIRELIRDMRALRGRDGSVPLPAPAGHFREAVDVFESSWTQVTGNHLSLSARQPGTDRFSNAMAFRKSGNATVQGNRLVDADPVPGHAPRALLLSSVQDMAIIDNTFKSVPLRIEASPGGMPPRPNKRITVVSNRFYDATGSTNQPVTGAGPDDTTKDDIRFVDNLFENNDPTLCMLLAPVPPIPDDTFGESGNSMPGGLPARICHLRSLAPTLAVQEGRGSQDDPPAPRTSDASDNQPAVPPTPPSTDEPSPAEEAQPRWHEFISNVFWGVVDWVKARFA